MTERKYPIGIQTFSRIIREGYLYVDKTDLVWQLAHYAIYVFMSRPRRFGKSLLTSTLESYFKGEKELFEGLKIMELEQEWMEYPVLHIDLSVVKGQMTADVLRSRLMLLLKQYSFLYGENIQEFTPGSMFEGLIKRAYRQTGKQVAVIIDEYDAPLLDVIHDEVLLSDVRQVMQEFYQPLKANERYIKFCFLTGITRLSQLNIFSTLNNLTNVTLLPQFSALCGITDDELKDAVLQGIRSRVASVIEMEELLKIVESLPETQRNVFNYDAQIVKLKEDIERNRSFKMKLYENLQEGMIGQEEYFLFKKSYESKIQSAEAAIAAVEQERQQAIEHNRENYAWIDIFKKYQNITFIERKTVVELLEEIIVHEDKKIRLCFRYGDQYTKLVELLENYSGTAE